MDYTRNLISNQSSYVLIWIWLIYNRHDVMYKSHAKIIFSETFSHYSCIKHSFIDGENRLSKMLIIV